MKIVIVDTTIHGPLIGGAQTFLPFLMRGLKESGHEVHLVTQGEPDKKIGNQIAESAVMVHTSLWKKNIVVEDAAPLFAKWVNRLKPDIYLISVSPDIGWVVLPYLSPAIATFTIGHTDSETFYSPARHYQSFVTKAIGVSDEVCQHYVSDCNFPGTAVQWIPYGVVVNPAPPAKHGNDLLQLIYVGRVEEGQKRISDLIKITRQLSADNIAFNLKIVGDGPEMPVLRNSLAKEIMDGKVEILGWRKTEEVINLLRQSDLFILTSAFEGFCIALIEAMANGCCPLVTDIKSGNKQLISSGQNGFIFPIGDTEKFVKKIKTLAVDKELLYTLRLAAWETGKNYSVERMTTNYHDCFVQAAAEVKTKQRSINTNFPLMETCRSKYPLWIRRIKNLVS